MPKPPGRNINHSLSLVSRSSQHPTLTEPGCLPLAKQGQVGRVAVVILTSCMINQAARAKAKRGLLAKAKRRLREGAEDSLPYLMSTVWFSLLLCEWGLMEPRLALNSICS